MQRSEIRDSLARVQGRIKRSALRRISVSPHHARLSMRLASRRNKVLHSQHAAKARLHAPDATHQLAADRRSRGGDGIYPAGSNSLPGPVALTDGLRQLHARIGACAQAMAAQS
jgi:hypothetical protein